MIQSTIKSKFNKEYYLNSVILIKYADRANIRQISIIRLLRISAHRLEIGLGRYNQTPRDERICSNWCIIVLGSGIIENEDHFLNHCDLNAASRRKVLDKFNYTPSARHLILSVTLAQTSSNSSATTNNSEIIKLI